MNINNLYEAVPVEKDLPPIEDEELGNTSDFVTGYDEDGQPHIVFFDHDEKVWATHYWESMPKIVKWLRPVTRESLGEWLREFGKKVWDACDDHALEYKMYPYGRHGGYKTPDKQTAITELITQTLNRPSGK